MNFSVLRIAGVPQSLFARILNVSPAAVSKWAKGGSVHPLRVRAISKLLSAVENAVDAKLLPSTEPDAVQQHAIIKRVLTEQLRALDSKH